MRLAQIGTEDKRRLPIENRLCIVSVSDFGIASVIEVDRSRKTTDGFAEIQDRGRVVPLKNQHLSTSVPKRLIGGRLPKQVRQIGNGRVEQTLCIEHVNPS